MDCGDTRLAALVINTDISDINECASCPCLNEGNCTDDVNCFICDCCDGFTGIQCETGKTLYTHCLSFLYISVKTIISSNVTLFPDQRELYHRTSNKQTPALKSFEL